MQFDDFCNISFEICDMILDLWVIFGFGGHPIFFVDVGPIFGFLGHPEIGTAITKCFEHLEDETHILDPGQLYP